MRRPWVNCERPKGVAILYIAGHGIEYSRARSYVLLEDFGSRPELLEYAVDINVIRNGMLEEGIAQTQHAVRQRSLSDGQEQACQR